MANRIESATLTVSLLIEPLLRKIYHSDCTLLGTPNEKPGNQCWYDCKVYIPLSLEGFVLLTGSVKDSAIEQYDRQCFQPTTTSLPPETYRHGH